MKTWSSLLFLIPCAISVYFDIWEMVVILSLVTAAALAYHLSDETRYYLSDSIFAWILIVSNSTLLVQSNFKLPYTALAIVFAIAAIFVWRRQTDKNYDVLHFVWHALSAIITTASIFAFVL